MSNLDLVILCGGKGTRLKQLTKSTPKPLLRINSSNLLELLIKFYQRFNIKKIYLLAGYKGYLIKKKFHKKKFNFIDCEVIIENSRLGTAGSLANLKGKIKNNFILINGDSFINYDFIKFAKLKNKKIYGKMLLTKNINYKENKILSNLSINKNKVNFKKKSKIMNAGVYIFKRSFLNMIKKKYNSLEEDVLPKLIENNKILGEYSKENFIDIGIKKNLNKARISFFNKKKSAVFLDRDGVLNKDFGHVHKFKSFKWTQGIFKTLKLLNKKFDYTFIITNQAGIAKGIYSEDTFRLLHLKIKRYLSQKNIYIDEVFYCPHHPTIGLKKYRRKCLCRKPGNLLIENAIKKWNLEKRKALMIGDKETDEDCAIKSKINFMYYNPNFYSKLKKII